jgi:DNA primase
MFRYTSEIVFCFDGDAAGRSAAWKALESSLPHLREGRQLRFLSLPERHDPDSLVREEGADAFRERTRTAQPFSDYFFSHLSGHLDLSSIEGRAALVDKAQPLIRKLPEGVFRDMIGQRLQQLTGHAPYAALEAPTNRAGRQGRPREAGARPSALRTFLALLLQNPRLVEHVDGAAAEKLRDHERGALIQSVLEKLRDHPHITAGGILEHFRDTPEETTVARLIGWNTQVAEDKVEEEFLNHLRYLIGDRVRESRLAQLIDKSRRAPLTPEEREELRWLTTQ